MNVHGRGMELNGRLLFIICAFTGAYTYSLKMYKYVNIQQSEVLKKQ